MLRSSRFVSVRFALVALAFGSLVACTGDVDDEQDDDKEPVLVPVVVAPTPAPQTLTIRPKKVPKF